MDNLNWIIGETYCRNDGVEVIYIGDFTDKYNQRRLAFYNINFDSIRSYFPDGRYPPIPDSVNLAIQHPDTVTDEEKEYIARILKAMHFDSSLKEFLDSGISGIRIKSPRNLAKEVLNIVRELKGK